MVDIIENDFGDRVFGIGVVSKNLNYPYKMCGMKIDEAGKVIDRGDSKGAITSMLSMVIQEALLMSLERNGIKCKVCNDSKGDLLLFKDGNWVQYELKTTMGEMFMGCTYSTKCDNLIGIKYNIDIFKKIQLGKQDGLIKELYVMVLENYQTLWRGSHSPTNKNSRTTLCLPVGDSDIINESTAVGKNKLNKKWIKSIPVERKELRWS